MRAAIKRCWSLVAQKYGDLRQDGRVQSKIAVAEIIYNQCFRILQRRPQRFDLRGRAALIRMRTDEQDAPFEISEKSGQIRCGQILALSLCEEFSRTRNHLIRHALAALATTPVFDRRRDHHEIIGLRAV